MMSFRMMIMLITIITSTLVEAELLIKPKGVDFLRISPDVRGSSLGDVGASLHKTGVSGVYWNPANSIGKQEIAFIHHELIEGIRYEFIGYSAGLKDANIAITLAYLHMGKIIGRDEFKNPHEYSSYKMVSNISYAKKIQYFTWGLTLKNVYSKIESEKAKCLGLDLGMLYNGPYNLDDNLGIGISLSNIKLTEYRFIREAEKLPMSFRFGIHYQEFPRGVLTIVELNSEKNRKVKYGVGIEYPIFKDNVDRNLYIRVGYNSSKGKGFRGGFGVEMKTIGINYCYEPSSDKHLASMHRIGLNLSLK